MEEIKNLSAAKRMLVRGVTDQALGHSLDRTDEETLLKEADKLPVHWLHAFAKRTGKASINALVHSTQKLVVYLLNQLYNNHSESKSGIYCKKS